MLEAPFAPQLQPAFAVPTAFDGPDALLASVRLSQYPRAWYPSVCPHSIYIGGADVIDGPDLATRRARDGYLIYISRETGPHICPNAYEDRLLDTIYAALATIPPPRYADGKRSPHHHELNHVFRVKASDTQARPFARTVEEIVRSLVPDFAVTELSMTSWPCHLITT